MTTTRSINKELLKQLMKEVGQARVAVAADCSPSLLQKLVSEGYETLPTISIIDGICDALNEDMDALFPRLETGEKAS